LNLSTRFGPLDLLCTIGPNLGYEELLPYSIEMDIGQGRLIRVPKLDKLIEIKERLGGEKELSQLPLLRSTLKEIQKKH
jgi:hypothetical protein